MITKEVWKEAVGWGGGGGGGGGEWAKEGGGRGHPSVITKSK